MLFKYVNTFVIQYIQLMTSKTQYKIYVKYVNTIYSDSLITRAMITFTGTSYLQFTNQQ